MIMILRWGRAYGKEKEYYTGIIIKMKEYGSLSGNSK
jgi:hypothetical protein